jgi:hypothetical protein
MTASRLCDGALGTCFGATPPLQAFSLKDCFPPLGEVPVRRLIGCADDIGTRIFGAQIFAQTAEG